MNCPDPVLAEEKELTGSVEAFFSEIWGNTRLQSHDIDHHRRVWNYAKEILKYYKKYGTNKVFIRNLLIACYFHDAGMSVERGSKHGSHSRKIAEQYLSAKNLNENDYADALDAINNHDDKDYTDFPGRNMILKILSIADDLDAFGSEGIWRYLEIYRARGVPGDKTAESILMNAAARFANFKSFAADKPELYEIHEKRYSELKQFFEHYYSSSSNR